MDFLKLVSNVVGSRANFQSQCFVISRTQLAFPSNLVLSSILALVDILVWVVGMDEEGWDWGFGGGML